MKKITIICIISLFSCKLEAPIKEVIVEQEKYADFRVSYLHLRRWEGNYAVERYDPGGETYAGIARNYNKKWKGWFILDYYKKNNKLNRNDSIPILEFWTTDYYLSQWLNEGFHKLKSQKIATYLFDYRNSGYICYIHLRRVLIQMGYILSPDIVDENNNLVTLDDSIVHILNIINEDIFIKKLQKTRMSYYISAVRRYPQQIIYLQGWANRTFDI